MYEQSTEKDELRARFTKWMEVTLLRARRKYLQKKKVDEAVLFLNDLSEEIIPPAKEPYTSGFDFESDWLADAFSELSPRRQEILTLLFVEELKPRDIAEILQCSPEQVYNRQYQALRSLRKHSHKEGNGK